MIHYCVSAYHNPAIPYIAWFFIWNKWTYSCKNKSLMAYKNMVIRVNFAMHMDWKFLGILLRSLKGSKLFRNFSKLTYCIYISITINIYDLIGAVTKCKMWHYRYTISLLYPADMCRNTLVELYIFFTNLFIYNNTAFCRSTIITSTILVSL